MAAKQRQAAVAVWNRCNVAKSSLDHGCLKEDFVKKLTDKVHRRDGPALAVVVVVIVVVVVVAAAAATAAVVVTPSPKHGRWTPK